MAHETFANVGLAKLAGQGNATANHYTRTDTQVFHHRVMDRAASVIEEDVDPRRTNFLHGSGKIGRPSSPHRGQRPWCSCWPDSCGRACKDRPKATLL